MNVDKFINISIRGRVAYSIKCFESVLSHFQVNSIEWKFILTKLWGYTNIQYFDDWHYCMAELIPDSVLESSEYDSDDFDYIEEVEFNKAYKLYSESNKAILDNLNQVFKIGISEFYGKIVGNGERTLENMKVLFKFMNEENIPFPSIEEFEKYLFNTDDGWGIKFQGAKHSDFI